ncbi:rhodanese-like domain-containing protein [Sansalvadorimonas sp. 2012CJ34-2]|uniref:Rhodanese-like domain-containing protein n=1 Tax=Parendozoicomonas callyspongiae TaxID=2942213 RepID=A0ABT0PE55_9GAMM|nr:rhodanese-like domain-containing protein [Sansalvadorimonas sp. 2012CJ34-2]MCL6269062.1 rhodanese-like domain-containing protein [Sansalvadorimonas sp. 2012CJ34-2]
MQPVARALLFPALFCALLAGSLPVQANDPLPESWKVYEEKYPPISIEQLTTLMANHNVTLIDANRTSTYQSGHIPGALSLVELSAENSKLHLPRNRQKLIVVYCGGPQCATWHKAADYASVKGYKNIKHFKGGLKEWKAHGKDLETSL